MAIYFNGFIRLWQHVIIQLIMDSQSADIEINEKARKYISTNPDLYEICSLANLNADKIKNFITEKISEEKKNILTNRRIGVRYFIKD